MHPVGPSVLAGKDVDIMQERHFGPVWFIPGENSGKYPNCNSVYIEDAKILIDPASDRERLARLKEDPGVSEIWLTHWHEDHFMHLDLFDDLPLYMSREDAEPLTDLEVLMNAYGVDEKFKPEWRPLFNDLFHFRPRVPAGFLVPGQVIRAGALTIEVIHTPGHTPGHLAFFIHEPRILCLGDYDLTPFGPWYGDVEASIEKTIASVRQLQKIPAVTWIAGHEKGIYENAPDNLWDSYLRVIDEREARLLNLLKAPCTFEDIVNACIVYGRPREPKMFFEFGERALMRKHLERLLRNGLIHYKDDVYCGLSTTP